MIGTRQKNKITTDLLKQLYHKGYLPSFIDFVNLLTSKFRFKEFGKPFFNPRGAAKGLIVDSKSLKDNTQEIKDDLDVYLQDLNDLIVEENLYYLSFYGEVENIKQRLNNLNLRIDDLLLKQYSYGIELFSETFRNTDNIDLSLTTAYIDPKLGYASIPISPQNSVRYPSTSIQIIQERFSTGYKSIGSSFLSVFNDFLDDTWHGSLEDRGFYTIELNITGKEVVPGHGNEIELNRIMVEPLTPLTINIEGSTDGLNWFNIVNSNITSSHSFEFDPLWILFLRFTITGNNDVGIRRIEIGKVGTLNSAVLISKAFTSDNSLYNLNFDINQQTPYGTSITSYIGTSNSGPWIPINPGFVKVADSSKQVISINASGAIDFISDNSLDLTSLWAYTLNQQEPIINTGELWRGVNQFKVESFAFAWDQYGDAHHIPDINDWNNNLGFIQNCYMSSIGIGNDSIPIPSGVVAKKESFLITYRNSTQEWWGVSLSNTSGFIAREQHNYKITTYLYSDRDLLINNAAGGIYYINSLGSTITFTNAIGWSLYVNGNRVVSDNNVYELVSSPGSGTILPDSGKSFPITLSAGWNKFDLLISIPTLSSLNSSIQNKKLVLLLRPSLFNFSLSNSDLWAYSPKLIEYPIWADGNPMKRVSEFFLKWNTTPLDNSKWAWRISEASGTASHVLLNYNPAVDTTKTIDGYFYGSNALFRLQYTFVTIPTNTIYYKAELKRDSNALQAPKIFGYKFLINN